jgi:putative transposase
MLYIRFSLLHWNVKIAPKRGIEVSRAARYWWHRFGPVFAAEI